MDESELNEAIASLAGALAERTPEQNWPSVTNLLRHGEEGEAMDLLIAIVVRFNVPISTAQHESIRNLVNEFGISDHDRETYRYLGDTEMLDRMAVVDEPSS